MNSGLDVAVSFLSKCRRSHVETMSTSVLQAIILRWAKVEGLFFHISPEEIERAARRSGFSLHLGRSERDVRIGIKREDVNELRSWH